MSLEELDKEVKEWETGKERLEGDFTYKANINTRFIQYNVIQLLK